MYLLYPWGKATLIVCVAAAVLLLAGAIFFPPAAAASATDPFPDLYAGELPDYLPDEGKVVYYTFDDGPSQNTVAILDTLRKKGVKATFFVTAQQTDDVDSASVLRRIVQEGHSIGVHTYTHDYHDIYADVESYLEDFQKIRQHITEITGEAPVIFRFPGGSMKNSYAAPGVQQTIREEMTRRGFVYYDWNVVSGDDKSQMVDTDTLIRNILSGAKGKDKVIILCHDDAMRRSTAEAVGPVIDALSEQGYRFERLTEQVKPIRMGEAG